MAVVGRGGLDPCMFSFPGGWPGHYPCAMALPQCSWRPWVRWGGLGCWRGGALTGLSRLRGCLNKSFHAPSVPQTTTKFPKLEPPHPSTYCYKVWLLLMTGRPCETWHSGTLPPRASSFVPWGLGFFSLLNWLLAPYLGVLRLQCRAPEQFVQVHTDTATCIYLCGTEIKAS